MTGFANAVRRERALLALTDPGGEYDAIEPLAEVRARQILSAMDPQRRLPRRPGKSRRSGLDGRELLIRLGADPSRDRGVIRCPAHEDHSPSLSWQLARKDKVLLHCFAGCDFQTIMAALG